MTKLRTQYENENYRFKKTTDSVLEKKLRLRKKYKRPDLSNNKLY
jgi:hypothetical protein